MMTIQYQLGMLTVSMLGRWWCKHDARVTDGTEESWGRELASAPAVHRWLHLFSRDFQWCDGKFGSCDHM